MRGEQSSAQGFAGGNASMMSPPAGINEQVSISNPSSTMYADRFAWRDNSTAVADQQNVNMNSAFRQGEYNPQQPPNRFTNYHPNNRHPQDLNRQPQDPNVYGSRWHHSQARQMYNQFDHHSAPVGYRARMMMHSGGYVMQGDQARQNLYLDRLNSHVQVPQISQSRLDNVGNVPTEAATPQNNNHLYNSQYNNPYQFPGGYQYSPGESGHFQQSPGGAYPRPQWNQSGYRRNVAYNSGFNDWAAVPRQASNRVMCRNCDLTSCTHTVQADANVGGYRQASNYSLVSEGGHEMTFVCAKHQMSPGCNQVTSTTDVPIVSNSDDPAHLDSELNSLCEEQNFMDNLSSVPYGNQTISPTMLVAQYSTGQTNTSATRTDNIYSDNLRNSRTKIMDTSNMVVNDMNSVISQLTKENKYL